MKKVILSLGSNQGEREVLMEQARTMLQQEIGNITKKSAIYESDSWGFCSHPFLNQIIEVETTLEPEMVLLKAEAIERTLGRTNKTTFEIISQNIVYHDRTMDIDILLYDKEEINTPLLVIPHSKLAERDFILVPLVELYGEKVIPPFQLSFKQMLLRK